jgi:hypothetical protein
MPALSLDSHIFFFDACKSLGTSMNPVFLLTAYDNSVLVLKREEATVNPVNLKYNLKFVKAVNPAARGKVLDPEEIANLKSCIALHEWLSKRGYQTASPDLAKLRDALNQHGTWFKMQEVKELANLRSVILDAQNNANKGPLRQFVASLNAKGGLESLGQVVAVDLFNQNQDRFCPRVPVAHPLTYDTGATKYGGKAHDLGGKEFFVLVNLGNVMLGLDNNKKKAVALDSFDPFSGSFTDVNQTIEQLEAAGGIWFGRMLTAGARHFRKLYAEDIVNDLEFAWGPRNRKFKFLKSTRLDSNAAKRIFHGMESAIPVIKQKLHALINKPGRLAPPGLLSRYAILNS